MNCLVQPAHAHNHIMKVSRTMTDLDGAQGRDLRGERTHEQYGDKCSCLRDERLFFLRQNFPLGWFVENGASRTDSVALRV